MEKLSTLSGRYVDNANFFALDDFQNVDSAELYSRLLNEFPNWLNEIKENFEEPCLILFGNKADADKKDWQVTKEEIEDFSKKMNLTYFETSAKANVGINEGFSYIINYIYDKMIPNQVDNNDVIFNDEDILRKKIAFI